MRTNDVSLRVLISALKEVPWNVPRAVQHAVYNLFKSDMGIDSVTTAVVSSYLEKEVAKCSTPQSK